MKLRIPLTRYDLHITKRGITWVKDGVVTTFAQWRQGITFQTSTPFLEQIYTTIASEFAKLDLIHIIDNKKEYKQIHDELAYIISERPNPLQTKWDFLFTMMYQLFKYGNALAFISRDRKGKVISIDPINVTDYELGFGYQIDDETVLIKYRNKNTHEVILVDYKNIIHLRLNPNDVFYGDLFSGEGYTRILTDVLDSSLNSLLAELKESGTVRGIVKVGNAGIGYSNGFANRAIMDQPQKIDKQQEIIERINKTKGGILVLDAGEEWQSLSTPFSTVSSADIDKYIDILLQFNGMNKKVVNGEATYEEMEVFYNKTIVPRIEQFTTELNYKVFSKTAITQGHRIRYFKSPFEYMPLDRAIDVAYKSIQDTTTNERRRFIYGLPPVEGGDELMRNKNFEPLDSLVDYYDSQSGNQEDEDEKTN